VRPRVCGAHYLKGLTFRNRQTESDSALFVTVAHLPNMAYWLAPPVTKASPGTGKHSTPESKETKAPRHAWGSGGMPRENAHRPKIV
jgi:hypothetical protein